MNRTDAAQLPWSTSNEDLVELFETVGAVSVAEILYDGTRSKGEGIVQFGETAEAQTASEKFTGYMYGGRPLGMSLTSVFTVSVRTSAYDYNRRTVQPTLARILGRCRQGRSDCRCLNGVGSCDVLNQKRNIQYCAILYTQKDMQHFVPCKHIVTIAPACPSPLVIREKEKRERERKRRFGLRPPPV